MTVDDLPREIAEGPDAIRQTVATAWPGGARHGRAAATGWHPPDPP